MKPSTGGDDTIKKSGQTSGSRYGSDPQAKVKGSPSGPTDLTLKTKSE